MTNAPAIAVGGLRKRFGELAALDGVDFEVPTGSVFGLLGPNGAGKTTAVRILATVLRPDEGSAEVLGRDVVHEPDAVRRRIGMAGQYAAVDPNLTGRENLELIGTLTQLPRSTLKARAVELLERFELSDAGDRPSRTYSGGMRRRLDIAASLVQSPPVLFLDEPTTGLDLPSRNELWRMVRELVGEGTTVLLTTQYLEEADVLADRIAVIDHGHVIANDTPANLKAGLGSTVIEMTFDDLDVDRALALIDGEAERDGAMVRITTDRSTKVLLETLRALDTAGIEPTGLTVREPSMDDVFLVLTGHRAEDTAPPAEAATGGPA
ncbi:MAG TPA: ATP-binding cassette domain-containing protein [Actinomycetota bacterium]|nr:ATP-binding cassette domain-containing protein [Actinomycetota bacterium]